MHPKLHLYVVDVDLKSHGNRFDLIFQTCREEGDLLRTFVLGVAALCSLSANTPSCVPPI